MSGVFALEPKNSQAVGLNENYCVAKDGSDMNGPANLPDDFMVDPSDTMHVIGPPSINGMTIEDGA